MDSDLPFSSNGPAYHSAEQREGVPLEYVGEKLSVALESLHMYLRTLLGVADIGAVDRQAFLALPAMLQEAFHKVVVAFLALHNMLASANDPRLLERLLSKNAEDMSLWIAAVERGGSISGIQL